VNRWVGAAVVALLLIVAWIGYDRPELFPGNLDVPQLVWLIMALLLVSGAGVGFWRFRYDGGRALAGLLFWAALIVALVWGYTFFS
jgi:asparagine N-glycosylation enzyme membrane subunit Stt3